MENKILTQEEIEKRKELFGYEMTQVIINLKGKFVKYNASNSPIKNSGLNEEAINKSLKFIPLPEVKLETKVRDIPNVSKKTSFTPMIDVKPFIKIENNVQGVTLTGKAVSFVPLPDIKLNSKTLNLPKLSSVANYIPFPEVKVVAKPVSDLNYVIYMGKGESFIPFNHIKLDNIPQDIPNLNAKVKFMPLVDFEASLDTYIVPSVPIAEGYKPFSEDFSERVVFSVPNTIVSAEYSPLSDKSVKRLKQDIPALGKALKFEPLTRNKVTSPEIRIPCLSVSSKFKPIEPAKASVFKAEIPNVVKSVGFEPIKAKIEAKSNIENVTICKISDYKPFNVEAVGHLGVSIPNIKVELKLSSPIKKKADPTSVRPMTLDRSFSTKDFYSLWEEINMNVEAGGNDGKQ